MNFSEMCSSVSTKLSPSQESSVKSPATINIYNNPGKLTSSCDRALQTDPSSSDNCLDSDRNPQYVLPSERSIANNVPLETTSQIDADLEEVHTCTVCSITVNSALDLETHLEDQHNLPLVDMDYTTEEDQQLAPQNL